MLSFAEGAGEPPRWPLAVLVGTVGWACLPSLVRIVAAVLEGRQGGAAFFPPHDSFAAMHFRAKQMARVGVVCAH